MNKKFHLLHGLSLFFRAAVPLASLHAGTFKTIVIDDEYSDWTGVPVVDSDPADNVGSVDLADTQIANDANYLYIRNTYHGGLASARFSRSTRTTIRLLALISSAWA